MAETKDKATPGMPETISNITQRDKDMFDSLSKGEDGWGLFSCFLDGQPTVAIVRIDPMEGEDGEEGFAVTPLYVRVTSSMVLTDHLGDRTGPAGSNTGGKSRVC